MFYFSRLSWFNVHTVLQQRPKITASILKGHQSQSGSKLKEDQYRSVSVDLRQVYRRARNIEGTKEVRNQALDNLFKDFQAAVKKEYGASIDPVSIYTSTLKMSIRSTTLTPFENIYYKESEEVHALLADRTPTIPSELHSISQEFDKPYASMMGWEEGVIQGSTDISFYTWRNRMQSGTPIKGAQLLGRQAVTVELRSCLSDLFPEVSSGKSPNLQPTFSFVTSKKGPAGEGEQDFTFQDPITNFLLSINLLEQVAGDAIEISPQDITCLNGNVSIRVRLIVAGVCDWAVQFLNAFNNGLLVSAVTLLKSQSQEVITAVAYKGLFQGPNYDAQMSSIAASLGFEEASCEQNLLWTPIFNSQMEDYLEVEGVARCYSQIQIESLKRLISKSSIFLHQYWAAASWLEDLILYHRVQLAQADGTANPLGLLW
jgi:hypothetical protein